MKIEAEREMLDIGYRNLMQDFFYKVKVKVKVDIVYRNLMQDFFYKVDW